MKFVIKEPVFNTCCTFAINEPLPRIKKLIERFKHDDETVEWEKMDGVNGFCITVRLKDNAKGHIIWMQGFSWKVTSIGILSHEIIHLVHHILDHKGIPIRLENDEVFAYLNECYLRESLWRLRKLKKPYVKA